MTVVLARVDERLVHGVTVNQWNRELHPKRYMVVDNEISKNEMIKATMRMRKPAGTGMSIIDEEKAITNFNNGKYDSHAVFILVKEPETLLNMIRGGVKIPAVNLGAMFEVSDSKVIALSDHIHSALERYNSGIELKNNFLWKIKRFYPEEFKVGKEALDIINQQFGIKLPEDEAGFITMHIVEAQMNQTIDDLDGLTQFIQKVIQILKYACHQEINEHSAYYYRFITHLRYLAQRIFSKQISVEKNDSSMLDMISLQYPEAYQAAKKVLEFIQNEYHCELASDELIYLTIHIEKLIRHTNTD